MSASSAAIESSAYANASNAHAPACNRDAAANERARYIGPRLASASMPSTRIAARRRQRRPGG